MCKIQLFAHRLYSKASYLQYSAESKHKQNGMDGSNQIPGTISI